MARTESGRRASASSLAKAAGADREEKIRLKLVSAMRAQAASYRAFAESVDLELGRAYRELASDVEARANRLLKSPIATDDLVRARRLREMADRSTDPTLRRQLLRAAREVERGPSRPAP